MSSTVNGDEPKIVSYNTHENKIISVGLYVFIKGNSKIIKTLKDNGWIERHRVKCSDNISVRETQYSGYKMQMYLTLTIE